VGRGKSVGLQRHDPQIPGRQLSGHRHLGPGGDEQGPELWRQKQREFFATEIATWSRTKAAVKEEQFKKALDILALKSRPTAEWRLLAGGGPARSTTAPSSFDKVKEDARGPREAGTTRK
jgi:hypothetical protein